MAAKSEPADFAVGGRLARRPEVVCYLAAFLLFLIEKENNNCSKRGKNVGGMIPFIYIILVNPSNKILLAAALPENAHLRPK